MVVGDKNRHVLISVMHAFSVAAPRRFGELAGTIEGQSPCASVAISLKAVLWRVTNPSGGGRLSLTLERFQAVRYT
jgi:hypothetical protein